MRVSTTPITNQLISSQTQDFRKNRIFEFSSDPTFSNTLFIHHDPRRFFSSLQSKFNIIQLF